MKIKKQISIVSLIFIIALTIVLVFISIDNIDKGNYYEKYGLRGIGTLANPYKISSEEDLETFSNMVNSGVTFSGCYIIQTCDIELVNSENYLPIGTDSNYFKGNYNGCGYLLSNVNINAEYAALFENMQGTLRNMTIESGTISGDMVASFVINSGESEASIINCYNYASLNGVNKASGIADDINNGRILFCQDYGNHSGNKYYSLCGGNANDIVVIGNDEVEVSDDFDGNLYELNGTLEEQARVINGYMSMNSYNFSANTRVNVVNNRFVLSSVPVKKGIIDGVEGCGTKYNPYLINSAEDFEVFKDLVNCGIDFYRCYWKQCVDIDLSNFYNFDPIGIYNSNHYFWGYYDGSGYKIKNLIMVRDDNCGLFGQLAGTIINVQLVDSYIEGACVGGLVSHSVSGAAPQLINCFSNAVVNGTTRSGVIVDNFGGGNVVLCIAKVEDNIKNTKLCSYAAENIIESYLIGNNGIDNASVAQIEDVETNVLNSSLTDDNMGHSLNGYIKNHFMIRNVKHNKLCLWSEDERLELSKNRQSFSFSILLNYIVFAVAIIMVVALFMIDNTYVKDGKKYVFSDMHINANHKDIYLIVIYGLAIIYMFGNIATNGIGINRLFFWALRDTFSDRLAMIESADTYTSFRYILRQSFYPPLNNILYWIPSLLLGDSLKNRFAYTGTDIENDSYIIMLWVIYMVLLLVMLFSAIKNSINDKSNMKRTLFAISFFIMGPVLYCIERGNSVLLAVFFSILFFKYKEDKRPLFQEFALIFLAIATSIKLYPIVFIVLCLVNVKSAKKMIIKLIRFSAYCLAINILAFVPYGGLNTIFYYINNLSTARGNGNTNALNWLESGIDFYNLFRGYYSSDVASRLRIILFGITTLVALIIFCNAKDKYEQTIILVIIICGFPLQSYYYVLSFFIIPLIQVYNKDRLNKIDYIIAGELLAIVGLCPYYFINSVYRLNGLISSIAMIFLIVTLVAKKSYEVLSSQAK